ncbi:MAG: hypothetical protein WB992_00750 [Bryobacteraceae bacterium]
MLALVTKYSQIGLDEHICLGLLNAPQGAEPDFEKLLGSGPARLVVRQDTSIRLAHPFVALEVLHELMGGNEWRTGLKDLCVIFIREIKQLAPGEDEPTRALIEDLFITRDEFASEVAARNFAPLIIDAGGVPANHAGQQEIFAELTRTFPHNSHYWNHRARHLIYLIKHDYQDAINFLDIAIEISARNGDNEMVHHQTKGLAYRFWVNNQCEQRLGAVPPPTSVELFAEIRQPVEDAFDCFRIAHDKKPPSRYPFVTRIQLTIEVAEALVRACGPSATIHDVIQSEGTLGSWLQRNYVIAVDDLEMLKAMRADSEPSKYETTCDSDLTKLYGDYDKMVQIWETFLPTAVDPTLARRSLASAYFARGGREWDNVPQEDLKQIVSMMELNVIAHPGNERDLKTWFQTARRLSSFSYYSAINKLNDWTRSASSAEAHYYLYIINFLMW